MEALRVIARPVNRQLVIDLPASLAGDLSYEVIVLPVSETTPPVAPRRRLPAPELAGSAELRDDLVTPASSDSDWDSA